MLRGGDARWRFEEAISFNESRVPSIVPVSEIGAVQVSERTSCCAWGGYGIRQNLAGETGYIADGGPSVRITHERPEGKAKVYVFSCTGAAELKEQLLAGSGGVVGDADAL